MLVKDFIEANEYATIYRLYDATTNHPITEPFSKIGELLNYEVNYEIVSFRFFVSECYEMRCKIFVNVK